MNRLRGERGSVTTEVAIIAPVAIALLCLIALVGRTATAREHVDEAARDAARAASLERDPHAAHTAATEMVTASMSGNGTVCGTTTVDIDTTAFRPGGQVAVTISCDIALGDLGLIGVPGTQTISSTAVSVVDLYRATQ